MIHPAKRDRWVVNLLAFFGAAQLVGGGTLVGMAVVIPVYALLFPGSMLLIVGSLILWFLLRTSYEITETSLIIRSGPVRWTVPLDAIEDVIPIEKWRAAPEWGFSLALRGLLVRYRTRRGGLTMPIRIAPRDRAAFLLELTERQPGLMVNDDGSLHRPANPDVTG